MAFHHLRARAGTCPRAIFLTWLLALAWFCITSPGAAAGSGPILQIEVDARDLPRRLLHTRIHVPCQPGNLGLWYPKWIPGTHAPERTDPGRGGAAAGNVGR